MAAEYLVTATNAMYGVLQTQLEPSPRQLSTAAVIGCNTLRRLEHDREFTEGLFLLRQRQVVLPSFWEAQPEGNVGLPEVNAPVDVSAYGAFGRPATAINRAALAQGRARQKAAREDFDPADPLWAFLRVEEEVLITCGMRPDAITDLLETVRREMASSLRQRINADEITSSLASIREIACRMAQEQDARVRRRERLRRLMLGVGGAAIIGVNSTGFAVSMGLSGPMSAVSGEFGAALVGGALAFLNQD